MLRPLQNKIMTLAKALQKSGVEYDSECPWGPLSVVPHYSRLQRPSYVASDITWHPSIRIHNIPLVEFSRMVYSISDAFRNIVSRCYGEELLRRENAVPTLMELSTRLIGLDIEASVSELLESMRPLDSDGDPIVPEDDDVEEDGTYIVDGCYDQIPEHLRRWAIVPHAVSMILSRVPVEIPTLLETCLDVTLEYGATQDALILLRRLLLFAVTLRDIRIPLLSPCHEQLLVRLLQKPNIPSKPLTAAWTELHFLDEVVECFSKLAAEERDSAWASIAVRRLYDSLEDGTSRLRLAIGLARAPSHTKIGRVRLRAWTQSILSWTISDSELFVAPKTDIPKSLLDLVSSICDIAGSAPTTAEEKGLREIALCLGTRVLFVVATNEPLTSDDTVKAVQELLGPFDEASNPPSMGALVEALCVDLTDPVNPTHLESCVSGVLAHAEVLGTKGMKHLETALLDEAFRFARGKACDAAELEEEEKPLVQTQLERLSEARSSAHARRLSTQPRKEVTVLGKRNRCQDRDHPPQTQPDITCSAEGDGSQSMFLKRLRTGLGVNQHTLNTSTSSPDPLNFRPPYMPRVPAQCQQDEALVQEETHPGGSSPTPISRHSADLSTSLPPSPHQDRVPMTGRLLNFAKPSIITNNSADFPISGYSPNKVAAWLERSKGLPLDIDVMLDDVQECLEWEVEVLPQLIHHVDRWRFFNVHIRGLGLMTRLQRALEGLHAPMLESLELADNSYNEYEEPFPVEPVVLFGGASSLPKLWDVRLWATPIVWDKPFSNLKVLELGYLLNDALLSIHELRMLFESSPELDSLVLCHEIIRPLDFIENLEASQRMHAPIVVPSIKKLDILDFENPRMLNFTLATIRTPQLLHLVLSGLGSDDAGEDVDFSPTFDYLARETALCDAFTNLESLKLANVACHSTDALELFLCKLPNLRTLWIIHLLDEEEDDDGQTEEAGEQATTSRRGITVHYFRAFTPQALRGSLGYPELPVAIVCPRLEGLTVSGLCADIVVRFAKIRARLGHPIKDITFDSRDEVSEENRRGMVELGINVSAYDEEDYNEDTSDWGESDESDDVAATLLNIAAFALDRRH
ncbi:hypothetical protein FRB99_006927 [Tulasnella sp. 403]|nr:hypothetical protein FRB99_006927 [Tulasnella sp. 403]